MKIAVVTENETTISQHFGRAPYYVVFTIENGKIMGRERRDKAGHHTFAAHHPPHTSGEEKHGYDAGAQVRHNNMADTIADCDVLIAGGMGWGAYDSLRSRGIKVVATDVNNIDEAVKLYLEEKLPNLMERLH